MGDKYWVLKLFRDQLRFGDSEGLSVWGPDAICTLHSALEETLHSLLRTAQKPAHPLATAPLNFLVPAFQALA